MYGQVFLGSNFLGLDEIRHNLWLHIQRTQWMKCCSLQWRHMAKYPTNVMKEIIQDIETSESGIFLFGPRYGEIVEEVSANTGMHVPYNILAEDRKLSFTHLEFKLFTKHLNESKFRQLGDGDFIRNRLLVIQLRVKNIDEWTMARSPPATDTDKLAQMKTEAIGFGIQTRPFNVIWHPGKEPECDYFSLDLPDSLSELIHSFLDEIQGEERIRVNSFLEQFPLEKRNHIQILGWSGLEDYNLYETYMLDNKMRNDELSFLTMSRSVISLPSRPAYIPRRANPLIELDFDFLFTDIEVIPHYTTTHSIKDFDGEVSSIVRALMSPNDPMDHDKSFLNLIRDLTTSEITGVDGSDIHGIPLMYGFNEFLSNPSSCQFLAGKPVSYADFDLPHLLNNTDIKVGIWGWWVSSFPIIIFSHMLRKLVDGNNVVAGNQVTDQSADLYSQLIKHSSKLKDVQSFTSWINDASESTDEQDDLIELIKAITKSIIEDVRGVGKKKGRIVIFAELSESVLAMNRQAVDIVVGSSSAMLPKLKHNSPFVPIIPEQGVFVWVNCVCAYSKSEVGRQASLVQYWLKPSVQKELFKPSKSRKYVGIPVINAAFMDFMTPSDPGIEHPGFQQIRASIKRIQPEEFEGSETNVTIKASLRPFSSHTWLAVEQCWNKLCRELREMDKQRI